MEGVFGEFGYFSGVCCGGQVVVVYEGVVQFGGGFGVGWCYVVDDVVVFDQFVYDVFGQYLFGIVCYVDVGVFFCVLGKVQVGMCFCQLGGYCFGGVYW